MNVLILGNGFDLDVNYKTRYSDFAKNVRLCWPFDDAKDGLGGYLQERAKTDTWLDLESALLDYASATDGVAYGIIQWQHSDRKQKLANMANTMGSTTADYNVQFAYLRKELETDYADSLKKIKNSDSIEYVAKEFCDIVERTAWNKERLKYANTVYDALA